MLLVIALFATVFAWRNAVAIKQKEDDAEEAARLQVRLVDLENRRSFMVDFLKKNSLPPNTRFSQDGANDFPAIDASILEVKSRLKELPR